MFVPLATRNRRRQVVRKARVSSAFVKLVGERIFGFKGRRTEKSESFDAPSDAAKVAASVTPKDTSPCRFADTFCCSPPP
jgi:hypothetical protein